VGYLFDISPLRKSSGLVAAVAAQESFTPRDFTSHASPRVTKLGTSG